MKRMQNEQTTQVDQTTDEWAEIEAAYVAKLERKEALIEEQREQDLLDEIERDHVAAIERKEALIEQEIEAERERDMERWSDRQRGA